MMIARHVLAAVAVGLLLAPSLASAQDSQPGLLARYSDSNRTVTQLVPLPNFRLRDDESIHPQIEPSFEAEWTGLLKIDRAGVYRVYADGATVQLDGQDAAARANLATGEHPLRIRFQRTDQAHRLELRWESEFFRDEPVPSSALRHAAEPTELAAQNAIERGRFLFAELACANCHTAGDWKLQSRRGPDLSDAGSRLQPGWLYAWLKDPHQYRPAAVMPVGLKTDQDRADVTAYVMSLKTETDNVAAAVSGADRVAQGKALFDEVGCVKCHDEQNSLTAVRAKYQDVGKLADFIINPHATDPQGRMPRVFDPATEGHLAGAVASYLFSQESALYATPPAGDARRGAQLFASHGCASCHTISDPGVRREDVLAGPAFGRPAGLPLRHYWNFDGEAVVLDAVSGHREKVVGRTAFAPSLAERGKAFEFDGQSFIELRHFPRPDSMTISVWVRTTRGGSIITWGRPGGGQRGSRELRMNIGQDGKNSLCYGEYNSDGGWRPVVVRPTDINLTDGQWHHIALVREGTSVQHYIDGKAQGTGKVHQGGGDYTDRLLIGALGLARNPNNRFTGLIDELSIWETALSAGQIAALAAGQSPTAIARPPRREVEPFDVAAGCLDEQVRQPLPDYRLNAADRLALQSFLTTVQPSHDNLYHTAPLTLYNLRIQQFRCTNCHELNDQNVQRSVAVDEAGRIVRVEIPPPLTGAGAKLTPQWIARVLLEGERNRHWMGLRMPHFGDGVHDLPELIASAAGVAAEDNAPKPDRGLAAAGLEMIGVRRGEVACIACHNYRGINRRQEGVVPAPDMAEAAQTVRYDWFERWMHDPQRLQPGTSMPQMFRNLPTAERDLQIARLWSALYYQRELPLPEGVLDQRTEGTRIVVGERPVVMRLATITPVGQIDRAINVGLPGGLNFTFDPESCRLRYIWQGDFLDAGAAWNGRGGNPVRAGNKQLLSIHEGHAIRIGDADAASTIRFQGYRLEEDLPVFRYLVNGTRVEHRITVASSRVRQSFAVDQPHGDVFFVGNGETSFRSASGDREGQVIRFQRAATVEFVIEIPIHEASGR